MKNLVFSLFVFTALATIPSKGFASSAICIDTGPEISFQIIFDGGLNVGENKSVQAWNRAAGSNQFDDLGLIDIHVENLESKTFQIKILSGKLEGKLIDVECPTSNLPF